MRRDIPSPNTQRQELIDKGHIEPDPNRDGLTLEDWENQDSFLNRVKQSIRRTYDDLAGRTKTLEAKAQGRQQAEVAQAQPQKAPEQSPSQSAEQKQWKAEMEAQRRQQRNQNFKRQR